MKFAAMAGSFLLSCLFLLPLAPAQAKTKTEGIIIHPAYEKTATHSLSDRLFLKEGIRLYTEGHYESALKILQIAFDRGDMKAGRYIGLCFENGYGVAPDAQLAAHWYQAASLRGDVTATYLLGTLYEKARAFLKTYKKPWTFTCSPHTAATMFQPPVSLPWDASMKRGKARQGIFQKPVIGTLVPVSPETRKPQLHFFMGNTRTFL